MDQRRHKRSSGAANPEATPATAMPMQVGAEPSTSLLTATVQLFEEDTAPIPFAGPQRRLSVNSSSGGSSSTASPSSSSSSSPVQNQPRHESKSQRRAQPPFEKLAGGGALEGLHAKKKHTQRAEGGNSTTTTTRRRNKQGKVEGECKQSRGGSTTVSPRSTLELASVALSAAGEDSTETLPGKALSSDKGNDSASLTYVSTCTMKGLKHELQVDSRGITISRAGTSAKVVYPLREVVGYEAVSAAGKPSERPVAGATRVVLKLYSISSVSSGDVKVRRHFVDLNYDSYAHAESLLSSLSAVVKGRPKRLLVLINPIGGRGRGFQTYTKLAGPVFADASIHTKVVLTTHKYHAAELAYSLDLNSVDGAVCVGGDGLFNEFYNGLLLRKDREVARKLPLGLIPAGSSNALLVSVNGHANPAAHAVYIATGCLAAVDILEMSPLLPATRDLSSPVPSTPNTTATTTTEQPLVLSAPLPRKSKAVVSDGVSTSTRASRPAAIDAKRKVQLRPKSAADSPADTRKQQRRKSADPALESDKREEQAEDDEDIDSGRPSASKAKTRKPLPSDVVEVGSTEEDADEEAFSADVHAEDAFKASPPNCSVSSMPSDGPRYGFVVVGTGFVGVVAKQAEAFRWMGPARYSYCAVKHFADPQFHQLRVRYLPVRPQRGHMEGKDGQKGIEGDGGDGGEEADPWVEVEGSFFNFFAFNVSGANAQTPPVLPDAKLDDGCISLCLWKQCSRTQILKFLTRQPSGTHLQLPYITTARASQVELYPSGKGAAPINLDGEIITPRPVHIKVLPGFARMMVPSTEMRRGAATLH